MSISFQGIKLDNALGSAADLFRKEHKQLLTFKAGIDALAKQEDGTTKNGLMTRLRDNINSVGKALERIFTREEKEENLDQIKEFFKHFISYSGEWFSGMHSPISELRLSFSWHRFFCFECLQWHLCQIFSQTKGYLDNFILESLLYRVAPEAKKWAIFHPFDAPFPFSLLVSK